MFKHHPRGLAVLFFTEMWERFGFYLMLGIFTLYMIDQTSGKGFSDIKAADIYGTYLALVYLTPFMGGLLADRILGYRLAISIGGALMGVGYIGLAFPGDKLFYVSLLLIIIGNGFFKPNISTLVGKLYDNEKYRNYKDSGFNIFYMGINIGAFICNFVAAYLRIHYGWGYAFAAAGIGMFIGLFWFWGGQHHVKSVDMIKSSQKSEFPIAQLVTTIFLPAIIGGIIGWFIPEYLFGSPLLKTNSNDAFIFAAIPIIIFYISLVIKAPQKEKEQLTALLAVFSVVILFWAIFHQNGSALTIYAKRHTDLEIPKSYKIVCNSLGIVEEIYMPEHITAEKYTDYEFIVDSGYPSFVHPDLPRYFINLERSKWPKPGKSINIISPEIFQSVNPFFVIIFTPLVVGIFALLKKRKKEPSTPAKIGIGMFITSLSAIIMIFAVMTSQNGLVKSSPLWLISSYAVITLGELCLSPMGLSLVSKLSPPRTAGLMMGGWFVATAIGNKLSGSISGLWSSIDNKANYFLINFFGALLGVLLMIALLKWLKSVMSKNAVR